jgi:chaperonin cofactor prefoldin
MKHKEKFLTIMLGTLLAFYASPSASVGATPRITDREIIESLAELKAGQKALEQKMDQRFEAVDQRFEAVDQRFEAVDQRIEGLQRSMEHRFDFFQNLLLVLIAAVFGLIGFVVWDRKTALKPLEQRMDRLEGELHRDLELQHEEGSRLTRLVKVLREMAKKDEKLAAVLRNFSLM